MKEEQDSKSKNLVNDEDFQASLVGDSSPASPNEETQPWEPDAAPAAAAPVPSASEKQPPPSWIGKKLGHFKLLRLIGQGNMGMVIQALDVNLERLVALKVLRKRITGQHDPKQVAQFFREARAAAKIDHPNVVRIYEIKEHEGWWYIAMEMVEGESLKRVVEAAGPLPPQRACPLIADAATALDVAHREGIIHRDIKPANLMITRGGRCKLTDFGLVRLGDENDPFDFARKTVGTPFFIAPEIIQSQPQTQALDIYSLGCTLYFALTGEPPFKGEKLSDVFQKHIKEPPPDIRVKFPEYSVVLSKLICRMMAKNPADRPTASDVAAVLRAESISLYPSDSTVLSSSSTGLLTQAIEKALDSMTDIPVQKAGRKSRITRLCQRVGAWSVMQRIVAVVAVLVFIAMLIGVIQLTTGKPFDLHRAPSIQRLAHRFPDAPATYGILPENAIPQITPVLSRPPAFSWVGKKDTTGLKYVASREGRYFYSIENPAAAVISDSLFVGYETSEQAYADGKLPIHHNPVWIDTPIDSTVYP
jgi:serine/threonine-protein kinase